MTNKNNDEFLLEIRDVKKSEAMPARDIVRIISKETKIRQDAVKDVLNAFVDLFNVELLTTGAWRYPGLPSVQRYVKKETSRYDPNSGERVTYPKTCYLKATVPDKLKQYHRLVFKNVNDKLGNTRYSKEKLLKNYNETKASNLSRETELDLDDFLEE